MPERRRSGQLSAGEIADLRLQSVERTYETGERLISLGAASTEVFYLLEGRVRVATIAATGAERLLGVRSAGAFVGEMSTLNNEPRVADVIADVPCRTIVISQQRFIAFLKSHPDVALSMIRMLAQRLQEMTVRTTIGEVSVRARAAERLLDLASSTPPGQTVELKLTQADLATWIDASREWTSRAVGELRDLGAITTARGRITVVDRQALVAATRD